MNGSTVLDRRPERLEDVAAWAEGLTPDEVAAVLPSLWADVCHEVREGTGKLRDAARVGVALAAALGHARVVRGGRGAFRGESAEATRRPGGGDQGGATSGGRTAARGRPAHKVGEGLAGGVAAEIVAAVLAGGVGRCLQLKAAMGERYGQQYLRQRVAELLRKDPRVRLERRGLPLWVVPAGAPAWRGTRVEREAAKPEGTEGQRDKWTEGAGKVAPRWGSVPQDRAAVVVEAARAAALAGAGPVLLGHALPGVVGASMMAVRHVLAGDPRVREVRAGARGRTVAVEWIGEGDQRERRAGDQVGGDQW